MSLQKTRYGSVGKLRGKAEGSRKLEHLQEMGERGGDAQYELGERGGEDQHGLGERGY